MTFREMVTAAAYAHAQTRAKDGPNYDRGCVNRAIASDCTDHGLKYDLVLDQVVAAQYRELVRLYAERTASKETRDVL